MIKVFADGAIEKDIFALNSDPKISGFTTNPTLMRQAGVQDYAEFCKKVLNQVREKPISFEVFSDDFPEMRRQALEIASWGPNVYVKIPVTNSVGIASAELISELGKHNVKMNVTAVFTPEQTKWICKALNPKVPAIISVFAGRIADTGRDPLPILKECIQIARSSSKLFEVLWASPREVLNLVQAEQIGCDIITMTPDLIKKTAQFNKDLNQFSLETVQMFKRDADSARYRL